MAGLTELTVMLGVSCTSAILERATFKLRKLVCVIKSDSKYPVARFLDSQPTIESLYIVSRPEAFGSLLLTALPILRDVAAPLCLLPYILSTRLSHVTRISSLGTIASYTELDKLATLLRDAVAQPAALIELVIGLDLDAPAMRPEYVEAGLSLLGYRAPWIGLLRLEVHRGRVEPTFLSKSLTGALHYYPYLRTLVVMSSPSPQTCAYIRPDPVHDASQHMAYLKAWWIARPTLERVVFPIGVYTVLEETALRAANWWKTKVRYLTHRARVSAAKF
ncbi:hypothetical protein FRC07_001703 [Ceratobasidium sp. 392]|nr:hypothetical protein FRC07_001703 [Ceratobasidium sp. 392]